MRRFDLIVLGAGPAGSAAAVTAARAGLSVALIDKRSFPRDKLCGGGVTGRAMAHFQDIFATSAPDCPVARRDTVDFGAFGQALGQCSGVPPLNLVMRRDFDAALVQGALGAGAEDLTGAKVSAIDPDGPEVTLESGALRASAMIAADGVNSAVARALFGRAFDPDTIGFALEVELPDAPRPLRIDFGAAEWGYGWQFPKHCGTTIGVGGMLRRNADMKSALAGYRAQLGALGDVPVKGLYLPFGQPRRIPGKGSVLLAGDAAGLVDPITGEGIAYALRSGQLAARAAIRALDEGHPDRALTHYVNSLRPIHGAIRQANLIRPLIFAPRLRGPFLRAFRHSTTLKRDYFDLLAGRLEYPQITRRLLARLPRFALSTLSGRLA
ncbi:geranylgeranyl reductase family protein [Aestuariicoccus sp. MJ-SS9]|uniref:geranylgeranyl reductase family protein n=1 Tax=Aestuariicoccus sp. MJ-SS9 TaxID=3079855 RepID=UPI00290BA542|nr:geranylgeranyl reductase family protein [Aestuariicoccus sp. MJ-SS9]MDU8909943.1 geranylgeranyl reductase family protein [Aestuariicoccus sp. MJ-SS9]